VDGNPKPSSILRRLNKSSKLTIHIPPEQDNLDHASSMPAKRKLEFLLIPTFQLIQLINSKLLLLRLQFPSPLRLTRLSSNNTLVESWIPSFAEPASIMPLPLSDTVPRTDKNTTSSETHGVPLGETKDTSKSLLLMEKVSAESKWSLSTHLPRTEII
jgi:hypothetical protein